MKKTLLYILLCVAFVSEAYAQRVIYHQMDVNYVDGPVEGYNVGNIDNAKFVYLSCEEVLSELLLATSQQAYDIAESGVYLSQALTTPYIQVDSHDAASGNWNFSGSTLSYVWTRFYHNIGVNAVALQKEAEQNNMRNYVLIARTLLLNSLLNATDVYGELPALSSHIYATSKHSAIPHFDTQAEIYAYLDEQFQDLLAKYNNPEWINCATNATIPAESDRLFAGDITKWRAYTKAIYARFLLRQIPNMNTTPEMCAKIIAAADDALNDTQWTEPRYNYLGTTNAQTCPWGPAYSYFGPWGSRNNLLSSSVPTTFFARGILGAYGAEPFEESRMTDRLYALDPRANIIMSPQKNASSHDCMRWLESNAGMEVTDKITYFPALTGDKATENPFVQNNGYIALITKEELLFIKAEAQFWAGKEQEAYATTKEAVKYNMRERYGIKVEQYDETQTAEDLKTNKASNTLIRYKLFFDVKLPAEGFTLAHLMQQKYVAMYLQPEQWTDVRRYNYSSHTNGKLYKGVAVYTINNCHNGTYVRFSDIKKSANDATQVYQQLLDTYTDTYSLRRPHNLYAEYWEQSDCYQDADKTILSDKAWINRINLDLTTYNDFKDELNRIGAWNESGEVNYRWLQKKMIWQESNK